MNILRKVSRSSCVRIRKPWTLFRDFVSFQNCVAEIEEECNPAMKDEFPCPLPDTPPPSSSKVTIIGGGQVGMACAFSILAQRISNEICIVDRNEQRLIGELQDLQKSSIFIENAAIRSDTDYCISADSRVVIITAGMGNTDDGTELSLAQTNAEAVKNIVEKFIRTSPNCIILMVTNPVDIMTYVALKASGFQRNRVFGSCVTSDSEQFRFLLPQRWHLTPAFSMVSSICMEDDPTSFDEEVLRTESELFRRKRYKSWAIARGCAALTKAVLNNQNLIMPVSTCVKGLYCIDKEVCLSMPCVINANGATAIINQDLTELEIEQLQASVDLVHNIQSRLHI